jgi:hypothetical protein
LVKLKLFHRSKTNEEPSITRTRTEKENDPSEEKQNEPKFTEEQNTTPIREYNETLYSKGDAPKKPTTTNLQQKQPLRRISWENAETIEQNVDNLKTKSTSSSNRTQKSVNTEKKVDFILLKKKNKS